MNIENIDFQFNVQTYVKEPVPVEVMHFLDDLDYDLIKAWFDHHMQIKREEDPDSTVSKIVLHNLQYDIDANMAFFSIETLEGTFRIEEDYYVIRGVEGEFYGVRGDIFRTTYKLVV